MTLSLTISTGTPVDEVGHLQHGTLRITRTDGNRKGRADFTMMDYYPPLGAAVVIADGATTYFDGLVTARWLKEYGAGGTGHTFCQVTCSDDGAAAGFSVAPFALSNRSPEDTYAALMGELGPISWWRLGESSGIVATDEMGRQNGEYNGSPTLGVAGGFSTDANTAVTLNGSSQWVWLGVANIAGQSDFTISLWAKASAHAASQVLYSERASPAANSLVYFYLDTNGRPALQYRDNAGTLDTVAGGAGNYCDGNWHHFAVRKAGTAVRIYADGILTVQGTLTATDTLTGALQALVGRQTGSPELWLTGSVDEVTVWRDDIGDGAVRSICAMNRILRYLSCETSAVYDPDAVTETHTAIVTTLYPGLAPGQALTLYSSNISDGWWLWQAPPINEVSVEWLNKTTPKWTATIGDPLPRLAKKF